MKNNITIFLATYQRYETSLPLCLMSILNQSLKPDRVVLVDDNKEKKIYNYKILKNIIYLFKEKKIDLDIYYGPNKGLTHAFSLALNYINDGWVLKIDDDNVLEYNVLELFEKHISDNVGAMSGVFLDKKTSKFSNTSLEQTLISNNGYYNSIDDIYSVLNIQMLPVQSEDIKKVQHLYSNYFFRRDIIDENILESVRRLSPSCYREDTILTHQIFRKGYDLLVIPKAKIFHLNSDDKTGDRHWTGSYVDNNEDYFIEKLKEWNVVPQKMEIIDDGKKKYVLKNGQKFLVSLNKK